MSNTNYTKTILVMLALVALVGIAGADVVTYGFESGDLTGWSDESTYDGSASVISEVNAQSAHTGNYGYVGGGISGDGNNFDSYLYPESLLPTDTTSIRVWYKINSSSHTSGYNYLLIQLTGAYDGSWSDPVDIFFQENIDSATGWQYADLENIQTNEILNGGSGDKLGYALVLETYGESGDSLDVYFDDITVTNGTGEPTPTPTETTASPTPTPTPAPTPYPDWPWCAQQDIFFRNDSSDIPGYYVMDHRPQIETTKYKMTTVSSATGSKQVAAFITEPGKPGVSLLGPGLWRFRTYLNVSSSVGTTTFEYKIFNRSLSGNETDLFYGQAITSDINSLTPTESLLSYARRNYTAFSLGDRLVIKVNASTSSVASRDAYIAVAGNTQASMVGVSYFLCPAALDNDPIIQRSDVVGHGMPVPIPVILAALIAAVCLAGLKKK